MNTVEYELNTIQLTCNTIEAILKRVICQSTAIQSKLKTIAYKLSLIYELTLNQIQFTLKFGRCLFNLLI